MSVRRSLSWSATGQVLGFLIGFGGSVVIARLLTPREVGVYAIAMATTSILTIFTSFSVGTYITREDPLTRETLRKTFTVNILLTLVLAAAMLVAGWVTRRFMDQPEVGNVLQIMSLAPVLGALEFVPTSLLGREMNFRLLTIVSVLRNVIGTGTTIACAASGLGATSLALGPLAAAAFSATTYNVVRRKDVIFRPDFRGLRPIITFGLQLMSIGGVAQFASRLSDMLLGNIQGLAALGIYSRASALSNMLFDGVYGLATRVLFSKLAKDLREKGTMHEVFVRSLSLITAVMWPLLIGLAILARPAIEILYGHRWLGAALPLTFLMIAQFIVLGFGMNWELFVLRHQTALQTRYEMIRAVFGVITFGVGSLFSIAGAAFGRVVEAAVGYMLYRPHMDRMAGTEPGELERVYFESLMLTVAAATPSLVLMLATGWSPTVSPLLIALAVGTGVAAWFALLVFRNHPLVQELRLLRATFAARRREQPAG